MKIKKIAGLEESTISDAYTGLPIFVSTTARKKIRESEYYKQIDPMSNPVLNDYLAGLFKSCGTEEGVLHYFLSKNSTKEIPEWIEVRLANHPDLQSFGIMYFFSVVRQGRIDIITLSDGFKQPKKARKIKIR